jgi:hypothetical protein
LDVVKKKEGKVCRTRRTALVVKRTGNQRTGNQRRLGSTKWEEDMRK